MMSRSAGVPQGVMPSTFTPSVCERIVRAQRGVQPVKQPGCWFCNNRLLARQPAYYQHKRSWAEGLRWGKQTLYIPKGKWWTEHEKTARHTGAGHGR